MGGASEAARTALTVTGSTRPELARGVRLHRDPLRGVWAVLAPEKVLWPDEISIDILARCDGQATVDDIVGGLVEDYDAPRGEIEPDVVAFLQEWADRLLIRDPSGSGDLTP